MKRDEQRYIRAHRKLADDCIKFALRLAFDIDLADYPDHLPNHRTWTALRAELNRFFSRAVKPLGLVNLMAMPLDFGMPLDSVDPTPDDMRPQDFRDLQKKVAGLFSHLWNISKENVSGRVSFMLTGPTRMTGDVGVFFSGSVPAIFLLTIALLLNQYRIGSKILRCPAPLKNQPEEVCNKIFLRIKKQRYCNKVCTDRVAQQAKRKREPPPKGKRKVA